MFFLQGCHQSAKCHIVSKPQTRKEILRKQGRCFVCFKKGHLSRACSSMIRCSLCKLRHHMAICDPNGHVLPAKSVNPSPLHQTNTFSGANPRQSEGQISQLPDRNPTAAHSNVPQSSPGRLLQPRALQPQNYLWSQKMPSFFKRPRAIILPRRSLI